ncbi:hypothetical protein AAFC00_005369 [Neodothiora populina]|uniref:Haloacid dehalogenase n=1 Tax=Neodothiora populina TaxID=2781224 RepID=A0ABR3PKN0_9PEZI
MTSPIPFQNIRVLSFDIYGTLIDWESGLHTGLLSSPLGPHLRSLPRKRVLETFEDLEVQIQKESPTMLQSGVNAEAVRRYAQRLGVVEALGGEAALDEAAKVFGDSLGEWPTFEDTVGAIQRLGQRFKLVPLSNVDNESWGKAARGPLSECRFDAVYTAENIGSYKPDPRNFEYLFEHIKQDFGAEKEQLCHVAQSLYHDHAAIKPFGITSVWVDRKGFMGGKTEGRSEAAKADEYGYQLRVETLAELADIIDKAMA